MNTRDKTSLLPDIQSQPDLRQLAIDAVGVKGLRYPVTIRSGGADQPTVADLAAPVDIAELLAVAEGSASCEVYGLLKRADEKYVTERAYDNPKFVEDAVRDAALALQSAPRVLAFAVEVENFESIHNHSAFARIASANFAH